MNRQLDRRKYTVGYWLSRIILLLLLALTFFPLLALINMSLKSTLMIQLDFLGLPSPIEIKNYANAAVFIIRPVLNSLYISGISVVGILILVALSGYAFGRMYFHGKEALYTSLLILMMIPYTLLIVPSYQLVNSLGWVNSYKALIIPYIAGNQIFGIMLARSFFQSMPDDMFESAKIEGAGEGYMFIRIALPLSVPVLITVGITSLIGIYNDYIWPALVISGNDKVKTFCQIAYNSAAGNGGTDLGLLTAAFVIGTIPLVAITASCLRFYLQGMLEGAIKG